MPTFEENELPKLLDLLYDAALDSGRWTPFLDALPSSFDGACGILQRIDVSAISAFHGFGVDPAYTASYGEHFASINPYAPIGFQNLPVGRVVDATYFLDPETVERTEFFHDWMRPQGITADHLAVSCRKDEDSVTVLSIAPHASVYREQKASAQHRLSLLVPHLRRALEIEHATARRSLIESALQTSLDALGLAAFVVDGTGSLTLTNRKAEELLRRERVLCVSHSKHLSAAHPSEDRAFAGALAQAACPPTQPTVQSVRLTSRASGQPYVAWALPMQSTQQEEPSHRSQCVPDLTARKAILVLVAVAERSHSIVPQAIQAVFKLSAAEARLARSPAGPSRNMHARAASHVTRHETNSRQCSRRLRYTVRPNS
ncbi:hypothetical protein SAMN05216338_106918 [Bradyrhizobium sp. Rc2d]|uniref:hypothetical protein n=1 Tax=Bradyrhizobium sp. Rc2d TaxID=1855321 RepID=UPI00087EA1CA|nr:hypothetical protein [Bradyrhizobium sp. Rc2d]SDJ84977.1 hypothetical protein SAMN05216338_106918 [Bradyrhizobium sp. Rc2d]